MTDWRRVGDLEASDAPGRALRDLGCAMERSTDAKLQDPPTPSLRDGGPNGTGSYGDDEDRSSDRHLIPPGHRDAHDRSVRCPCGPRLLGRGSVEFRIFTHGYVP